jgi:hypothetical protein
MTFSTILLLMAVGAIVAGVGSARLGLSAWRVFGVALVPTAIVLVLAERESSRPCDSSPASGTAGGLFETAAIMSVTFFAAAAVAAIADAVRLAAEKEHGSALTRLVGVTLMSALGVGIVFYSVLSAALHCD